MKTLPIGQHFHHRSIWELIFGIQGQVTLEVNSRIWPKFELIREFMAVLAACKFDEDLIKIEGTIDRTRSNMGFFSTLGQVTLDVNSLMWLEVEFIRDFMAVLVTCKIEEDWIKNEVAVMWTTLSPL